MDPSESEVTSSTDVTDTARRSNPEELFQVISDYCREGVNDLNLAVDVGCGPGKSTVGFAQHFKQVIGVDINEADVADAPKHIPNCQFKVGCATNLDFLEPGSVDLFVSGMAFHLMPQQQVLAEADRVLRPGGTLAIFFYGIPTCNNQRMDQVVKWMLHHLIPRGASETTEVLGLQKDILELPYPGWIRIDDIVLSQRITPEDIMSSRKCLNELLSAKNGHEDPEYERDIEERMTAALKEVRDDPEADGQIFELRYPTIIVMGHKPL